MSIRGGGRWWRRRRRGDEIAPLGRTGVFVSRIAFGTMPFGGGGNAAAAATGSLLQVEADRIVGEAIAGGIT
jgi:aryl-alcohol dehydrogenase-like predicted oxidoreductase